MPGPYGATDGGKLVMQAAYMPPLRVGRWVSGCRKGFGFGVHRGGKYLLAHRAEKLYTDTIIMYGWNEP